jgi:hypothetical protein
VELITPAIISAGVRGSFLPDGAAFFEGWSRLELTFGGGL